MRKPTTAMVAGVVCVLLLAAAGALGGFFSGRDIGAPPPVPVVTDPSAARAAASTPSASAPSTATAVDPAALAAALGPAVADPRLGGQLVGSVVDVSTGTVLLDRSAATAVAPASTAKIATAAAVFAVHAPTERIRTTVVADAQPGTVVLVGAGDPTLSAVAAGSQTLYKDAARISDLAAPLKASGVTKIVVDGALFSGPAVSPSWLPEDVPTDYAGAITAVMVDGGRDTPTAKLRSANPALAAGVALAAELGLPASAVSAGTAPAGAVELAHVDSAPYAQLVRQMLQDSDNVVAEVLGRQVALAVGQPASFSGEAAAIRAALAPLGVDVGGGLTDSSGLAPTNRIAPAAVTGVLGLLANPTHPKLAQVAASLPIAGWSGTLVNRFVSGSSKEAAGDVRAKTGTLTGVSALAGLVATASGRLLAFSFVADKVGPSSADTAAAEAALDQVAAAMASCA